MKNHSLHHICIISATSLLMSACIIPLNLLTPPSSISKERETVDTIPGSPSFGAASELKQRVIELTNQERQKQGLAKLIYNAQLEQAAQNHADNMAKTNRFDHTLDGQTPFDRMSDAGYRYGYAAENIANGQSSPEEVVESWMNSPGHRKNILNTNLKEIGIGYSNGSLQSYWVQNFGSPLR